MNFLLSPSRAPRRGQALILAVLVMLFAALLSSAFLVLIASNGRQVGRETDRLEASRNADKAIDSVRTRIKLSSAPDSWNPRDDAERIAFSNGISAPPPAIGTVDHDYYWSQLDSAMGWDDPSAGFIKVPDPRNGRQVAKFLVSSKLLGYKEQTVGDDDKADGGDKRFMLKVTVIGLSSKNPEAWSRRVLYKPTNWNGSTFAYENFVTATDPDSGNPIESTLTPNAVAANPTLGSDITVSVYSSKVVATKTIVYSPHIADVGSTIMVSDGVNQPLVGVIKSSSSATPIYNLTVRVLQAGTTPGNFAADAKVAVVGSLFENVASLNQDGNGTAGATLLKGVTGVDTVSLSPDTKPFGGGAYFNSGVNVPATISFGARPPVERGFAGGLKVVTGQNALTSVGPVSLGDPTPMPTPQLQIVNAVSGTPIPIPTPATAADNRFLTVSLTSDGTPIADTFHSEVDPGQTPRRIPPAQITFSQYATSAIFPFHILNSGDVENFNGQPLTTSQLQRLWQRKSFPVASGGNVTYTGTNSAIAGGTNTTSARLCYGRPGNDSYIYPMSSGSLEQKGIRGWISPWEFLPRGAQVILKGTKISIIQDPLLDGTNKDDRPNLAKAANAATREFSTGDIDPPANGIICAEGNLRVSGNWTGAPLTIVSNNNIYIEGQLSSRDGANNLLPGKVALLAKKNVVLNPTQFVARPEGTVDTSVGKTAFTAQAQAGGVQQAAGKTLTAKSFKFGDKVAVFRNGVQADGWHKVARFDDPTNPTYIQLSPPLNSTDFPNGADVKVKLACDPPLVLLKAANKANGVGATDIPANEHFVSFPPTPTMEANTQELAPTDPPNVGTTWAYKFSVGGDTLARKVPFGGTIGVAASQGAQMLPVRISVRAGDDSLNTTPNMDNGQRQLSLIRPSAGALSLLLAPQPGSINGQQTLDARALGTGSPVADSVGGFGALDTYLFQQSGNGMTVHTKSRWRVEDIFVGNTPPALNNLGNSPARRLATTTFATFTAAPNIPPAYLEDATPTIFRVPLTSSVLLFNSDLPSGAASTFTPLLNIGSAFDYQGAALPAEDAATTDAAFYGRTPVWNATDPAPTDNSVTYAQAGTNDTFAFTRDGAGDYLDALPAYYLSAVHFQQVGTSNNSAKLGTLDVPTFTFPQKINMSVEVDATIYAEGGSWFVIPVPTPNANNAQVADADQQIEWRRPGYAVTVNADIAQMMTPTATVDYDDEPDPDGVAVGAMQRWTDTLSYQADNGSGVKWQTIKYNAAPLPAIDSGTGNIVPLPQLPASTDILYIYSN